MIFSYYAAPVTNTRPAGAVDPLFVASLATSNALTAQTLEIRDTLEQKQRQQRKRELLPYATFGGCFTKRHIDYLRQVSGLVCLDFDHVGQDLYKLRAAIMQTVPPLLMFISPSGDGLKVVYDCRKNLRSAGLYGKDLSRDKEGKAAAALWYAGRYAALITYLEQHLVFITNLRAWIDEGAHDITRACYLCADDTFYINPAYLTLKEGN